MIVNAWENETFVLPQGTEVTAEALEGDGCYFEGWCLDEPGCQERSYENPQVFYMYVNYEAWAYSGEGY